MAYTILLFASLAAMAVVFAFIVEDEIIERLMVQQSASLVKQYELTGIYPGTTFAGFKVYTSIESMPEIVRQFYRPGNGIIEVFSADEHHYHVLTLSNGHILVADVSTLLVVSNPTIGWLIFLVIFLLILLMIAIYLASWITRVTTRPVILLSQEVKKFPGSGTRFSASERKDKIGYLANCIELAVKNLNDSLKRETDFTRDVSHELRTPLTILKNDVMTCPPGVVRDRQLAAIEQMDMTINALLTLARAESVNADKFSLTALIEEALLTHGQDLESGRFEVQMLFSAQWYVTANRQLALLVINNLLVNGMRHSSQGRLAIDIVNGELVFSNQHTPHLSPRADVGVGIGQGLYLTRRICDVLGWSIDIVHSENSHQVVINAAISR